MRFFVPPVSPGGCYLRLTILAATLTGTVLYQLAVAQREPVAQAIVSNQSDAPRELVVGISQSPARNRFTLQPGQQRTLHYPFVGQVDLIVAELRDGQIAWEAQVQHGLTDAATPLRLHVIHDALITLP